MKIEKREERSMKVNSNTCSDKADIVLLHGSIYTEDPEMPWAQALAIKGKRLVYVGSDEGAKEWIDDGTSVIDFTGKMVIPGLLDGHTHPATVSKTFWFVRGPLTEDREELMKNLREYAEKYPKEEKPYFYYESYFDMMFGKEGPNRRELDEIISDRPARIQEFGDHACWYNTVALDMLRDENGVPHNASSFGSAEFIRDEDGDYTGWCMESTVDGDLGIFEHLGWQPESVMNDEMTQPLLDYFRQYGVMGMMDGYTEGEENLRYIYELDREGRLGMFYEGTSILGDVTELDQAIGTLRQWQEKYTTEHIRCNIVKFSIDGTNENGDCLSTEPFHNDPEGANCGSANATTEEMRDVLVRLNREGIDFHVHIACDGSFRLMCDAVEAAREICGNDWKIKVTFAHCELIHPDEVPRVKELGIYIDSSPHWDGGYFGEGAIPFLGKERWETMYDYTGIIEEGGKVGFSSDVFSYAEASRANPMIGMQVAMTRVDPWIPLDPDRYPGSVRPPEKAKLSLQQLVHGYTAVNAERMRLDDKLGSLKAGKLANSVVFGEDIFEHARTSPENFGEVEPEGTWFEGEERHIRSTLKRTRE